MSILGDSEWADFKNLLKKHGYTESDFEVNEVEAHPGTVEPSPIRGSLIITRKQNSFTRVYPIGPGSLWLSNVEDDLAMAAFGVRRA